MASMLPVKILNPIHVEIMNSICHKWISAGAVRSLSGDAGKYWSQEIELLEEASNFPDIFWPGEGALSVYLQKYPEWRDYIMIPLHSGVKNCHEAFNPLRIWETYPEILSYLIDETLESMNAEDCTRAVKFAGILSHLIGDTGQAAHIADPRIISALFQDRDDIYLIHTFIENNPLVFYPNHEYHAKSLGDSSAELKWMLLQKMAVLKRNSLRTIVPIMSNMLSGNFAFAAQYASNTIGECADLLADLLLTLFQIVHGGKNDAKIVSLCELESESCFCDGMFNYLPQINRIPGEKRGDSIPLDIGFGEQCGIALLPNLFPGFCERRVAFAQYLLPPGVFRFFRFSCGLNRRAERNETSCIFEIYLDEKLVWSSSAISVDSPCTGICIDLGNANSLRISTADGRKNSIQTKFFYPCFINPELVK